MTDGLGAVPCLVRRLLPDGPCSVRVCVVLAAPNGWILVGGLGAREDWGCVGVGEKQDDDEERGRGVDHHQWWQDGAPNVAIKYIYKYSYYSYIRLYPYPLIFCNYNRWFVLISCMFSCGWGQQQAGQDRS